MHTCIASTPLIYLYIYIFLFIYFFITHTPLLQAMAGIDTCACIFKALARLC